MLTLINANRMMPPIAPLGIDYVAASARKAGMEVDVLDLCLANDPQTAIKTYFGRWRPELVGLSLRNVDDCFWPSGASFVPELQQTIALVRAVTDAPIVLGGVGFSILAAALVARTGVDFGICGDGEQAIVELLHDLRSGQPQHRTQGLLWHEGDRIHANSPAWPRELSFAAPRDAVDNATYFRRGGQIGVETKRGCNRQCVYCADPLAKGTALRLRDPVQVADEVAALLAQQIDVLHLCDAEFNIPPQHAKAVCDELLRRRLGNRVRWYAYLAVTPLDAELIGRMAAAGCVGINFTSDSASPKMLAVYRQPHGKAELAQAVELCRRHGIAVMLDLLLGGPGETAETLADTIGFVQQIGPDCAGTALGVRIYPKTALERLIAAEGPLEANPSIRRHYGGPIDLVQPTFYIAHTLGERPAQLVRQLIAGDQRFFEPEEEQPIDSATAQPQGDHNYNANQALCDAIAGGARGAYWDILRRMRRRRD
jgi:tryptophan 2-C-methyltransferase